MPYRAYSSPIKCSTNALSVFLQYSWQEDSMADWLLMIYSREPATNARLQQLWPVTHKQCAF
jgi:hypothetical protein